VTLSEPDLTPARVAAAVKISVRLLYLLFEPQLMWSMCWGGGWGNAARYWKAHRAEPGPFGLSANTSASVPAWCVAADLSDAKAAAGGHSFGMRGSTSSPNSRIDACASASAISLKLTCSEAISKSPIC
jgi:hypothetical protein